MGDDKFYIVADDNNAYFSEITQKLDNNIIKLKSNKIYFKNENITISIDSLSNNWGIIEYIKGNKPMLYSFVDYNLLLNDRTTKGNIIKKEDFILIDKRSLIVKKNKYKNLIFSEMSLQTTLKIIDERRFLLIYEYNASSTKMKQIYSFIITNSNTYLTSKEILKYSNEGSGSHKIYLKNYKLNNQLYSDLENIGSSLKSQFFKNESLAVTTLYNDVYEKITVENFTITNEDRFIEAPINEKKYIKDFVIIDINKLNDVAYYLEQSGAYNESIFLLNTIIKKEPLRVVAWINLADAQWEINDIENAKKSYQKYISLMKVQKKDLKKIPQRVYETIK